MIAWIPQLYYDQSGGRSGWNKEWHRQIEQNDINGKDFTVASLRILKNVIW